MNSKLNPVLDYVFYLTKDRYIISDNTNFIIIDQNSLREKIIDGKYKDEDGFTILNSSNISNEDECIIQQEKIQRKNPGNL